MYQKPENYVRDFLNEVLNEIQGQLKREEVVIEGYRLFVDYQLEKLLIEAKAPGKRELGRDQIKKYLKLSGYRLGLLIDIPTKEYYNEYPRPYSGKIGFELYLEDNKIYERLYYPHEIDQAKEELKKLLNIIIHLRIASVEPRPDVVLTRVRDIVRKWEIKIINILNKHLNSDSNKSNRARIYMKVWKKNMELLYGSEVLQKIGNNITKLFVELTIYTTILKILGATIMESILGGGRYTIPLKLMQEKDKAATALFWERKMLQKFNINYLFERDEYDWIFSPDIAQELSEFFYDIGIKLSEIDWSRSVGLDLLKRVYQNIVDIELRRQLGEFYTPDWLAKLILWRGLYILVENKKPDKILASNINSEIIDLIDKYYKVYNNIPKFIDPTCGSFTFGIQYINALINWYYFKKININPVRFANLILQNVIGIDLNPVAVITAKVNYLLQIYKLLMIAGEYLYEEPMIPIYRVDLVALHESKKFNKIKARELTYYIVSEEQNIILYIPLTVIGIDDTKLNNLRNMNVQIKYDKNFDEYYVELKVPRSIIKNLSTNITKLHRALMGLRLKGISGFEVESGIKLNPEEKKLLNKIYETIKILEKFSYDNVWFSILVNHILAFVSIEKKFDLVLGNLPWVNISKYPKNYSNKLRKIAKELGVYPPTSAAKKLDISIILFSISVKYLCKKGCVVGLMVPSSIFRGLHGNNWRLLFINEKIKIYEIFDLENVQPFEGVKNQPGIVLARR